VTLKFDLDPTWKRVVAIAVIEFLLFLINGLSIILSEGKEPTTIQIIIILLSASSGLLFYVLTFIKTEETEVKPT